MLWTAPDGWVNLGGGAIRKITCEKCSKSRIGEKVKKKKPHHQMLWTAPKWVNLGVQNRGIICSTIRKITCEKCSKSRIGEEIKKKNPQP